MPIVIVPPPYQGPTRGIARVDVAAATVRAAMEAVERQYPGFGAQIFSADGELHRFVSIFRNGEPVETSALEEPVFDRDEIEVVAAIAGG